MSVLSRHGKLGKIYIAYKEQEIQKLYDELQQEEVSLQLRLTAAMFQHLVFQAHLPERAKT
jgi:hypothetical protein